LDDGGGDDDFCLLPVRIGRRRAGNPYLSFVKF
jgi:hypothetical protein